MVMVVVMVSLIVAQFSMHAMGRGLQLELIKKTKQKLESDFARALKCWDDFTNWRFVTNASVGPTPMKSLQALRKQHGPQTARPITIDLWKTDDLWQKVAAKLTPEQLDEVIPGVPHVACRTC